MTAITEHFFLNCTPDETQLQRITEVRAAIIRAFGTLDLMVPSSPEKTLCQRALKDAQVRAIEAILFRAPKGNPTVDESPLKLLDRPQDQGQ